MPRFVIERDIPEIGSAAREDLRAAAPRRRELAAYDVEGGSPPVRASLRGLASVTA